MGSVGYLMQITSAELASLTTDEKQFRTIALESDRDYTDIDKAWHGLHYLLSKKDSSLLSKALLDGQEVLSDVECTAIRCLPSDLVKQISEVLQTISVENLASYYNPREMKEMEIYPFSFPFEDLSKKNEKIVAFSWESDTNFQYLWSNFQELADYYTKTSSNQMAMLIWVS